ncbi:MAG: hypothetical protein VX346_27235 [Planctomycetota bacterium]|nr:hypothetical protein [Planctomycetota bacterium]
MSIIVLACGSVAVLVLSSGQPIERTGVVLLFLAGIAALGWLGLRGAARRTAQSRAWLKRPASRAAPKWRVLVSSLLLLLGLMVVVAQPTRFSGYVFGAVGVAGLLGVNVFLGGPLDKRRPNS